MICRKTKKGTARPWAFSLQDCSILSGNKHPCQLAVHTIDGQLYLRALTQHDREEWLKAINNSAAQFEELLIRSKTMHAGESAAFSEDAPHAANQTAIEKKVGSPLVPESLACLVLATENEQSHLVSCLLCDRSTLCASKGCCFSVNRVITLSAGRAACRDGHGCHLVGNRERLVPTVTPRAQRRPPRCECHADGSWHAPQPVSRTAHGPQIAVAGAERRGAVTDGASFRSRRNNERAPKWWQRQDGIQVTVQVPVPLRQHSGVASLTSMYDPVTDKHV